MASRRHSSRRATTHRHLCDAHAVIGLRDPRGQGRSSITDPGLYRRQRTKDIVEQHLAKMKGGLVSRSVERTMREYDEAREDLRSAEPALALLEEEQVKKRLARFSSPSLGSLEFNKPEGYNRMMVTQLNGCATRMIREVKVEQCTQLLNRYDIDLMTHAEHGLNMARLPPSKTFDSFFDAEIDLRSTTSHNSFENPESTHQQGGTGIMAIGELIQYYRHPSNDFRNLGRWSSCIIEGNPQHRTRVVSAYCVGKNKPRGPGRVYQQHLRYIQHKGLDVTPYDMFCQDLLWQLKMWKQQGDRIILTMDANEHILSGTIGKMLTEEENGLDLVELSHKSWREVEPNTYIDGTRPIDGVWASDSLEIGGFKMLSFGESVGDHRTMIFDVSSRSLIGKFEHRIVRAGCRRLNCKTHSLHSYNRILEALMTRHRMDPRLDAIIDKVVDDTPTKAQHAQMEALDRQMVELQKCAERRCRKIIRPNMEFSEPVKLWHERVQAYKALIRWKTGCPCNSSNIIRTALRRGVENPREMTLDAMRQSEKYCKARRTNLRETAPELRRDFLRNQLVSAENRRDVEAARKVKSKMLREGSKKMWYFINRSQKDKRCSAFHFVQTEVDGQIYETSTQYETESSIFEEIETRFQLACEAPISRTKLIDQLGYLGDSEIAAQIVGGTYEIPAEVDDATALILEEIGRIGVDLSNGDTTITITPEEFQYFWKRVKEGTASSYSGIHYGHYKAAAHSEKISSFLSKKITLISRTGCPPERWSYGLTVMLEKIAGIALVNKLRAILLMEADFNFHNKLIFGKRMLDQARANGIIPPEQYSEQQSTADDGTFDKILQSDISRQFKQRMSIISADAANCYDRVHHTIMAMVFLSLGVDLGAIISMLRSIQLMTFFLRTGWGESHTSVGGDVMKILHGLCQGNGAAPASWLVLSSVLVRIYRAMGFGATMTSPITRVFLDIAGVLFVDDTDLYIMDACLKSPYDLWHETQSASTSWGKLLLATGGALKPVKCFYYMIDYEWQEDGSWTYSDLVDTTPQVTVPLADGSHAGIDHLPVTCPKKTLGIWTSPAGDCTKQIEVIVSTVKTWGLRLQVGKLPAKWAWKSYFHQLWAKLRYGLGTNSSSVATLEELEEKDGALRKIYRGMLSYLGVNKNIKAEWRHLPSTFGGVGLRKLLAEVIIGRINLFVQHYRTPSTLGRKLTISLEALQLEVGTNVCPLNTPFHPLGPLATPCWCKSLWEGLDHFGFTLDMDAEEIPLPRANDRLLSALFVEREREGGVLRGLQRCRICWNALFLSDLTSANGRQIERRFLSPPSTDDRHLSSLRFGQERPTTADWAAWAEFWGRFTEQGLYLVTPLGDWVAPTHRSWEWHYLPDSDTIERAIDDGIEYYAATSGGRTRGDRKFAKESTHRDGRKPEGFPCSVVRGNNDNFITLHNYGPSLKGPVNKPDSFMQFLRGWGGEWMWSNVRNEGPNLRWVVKAISNGTAVWVTDGSYNKKIAPHTSGAGWLVYCTATKLKMSGHFYERSQKADSYRAELLGLLAIHILLAALEEYYKIPPSTGKICCDNTGALYKSKEVRRRIPVGSSQADIKRAFRNVKTGLHAKMEYEWVESHQDRLKLWFQLSLEQQLNCECDTLAKEAVTSSLSDLTPMITRRLPRESVAVYVNGLKQTSDVSRDVRYSLGKSEARKFYTRPIHTKDANGRRQPGGGLGWSKESFDAVAWEALDSTLDKKGQMYKQWLCKQTSGFCGTQVMVNHWDKSRDGNCPDCGRRETASHLNLCSDPDRTCLLHTMVEKLQTWLDNNYTHPELAYWLPKYILLRGTRKLSSFPYLSLEMRKVAASQDLIPWTCFMEGKLSKEIFLLQRHSLARSPSRLTIADWSRHLISQVLQMSHAQWVFRNVSLHDAAQGYIRVQKRESILQEVDRLAEIDPILLPEDSKYLLEIDFSSLHRDTLEKQSYWLLAMKAAVKAGQRTVARSRHATARQRRASARASSHRQVNGGANPRTIAAATMRGQSGRTYTSRAAQEIRRRRGYVVAGAAEAVQQIRVDFADG